MLPNLKCGWVVVNNFCVMRGRKRDPFAREREKLRGGRQGNGNFVAACNRWSAAMPQPNDLSRSLVALDQNSTIIAVIEMSQSSWLIAGVLPGIERQPRKKLEPNAEGLLGLLHRWRDEAIRAGKEITRHRQLGICRLTESAMG
jgi:hypothetical protein